MNKFKSLLIVVLAAFCAQTTMAQDLTKKYPYGFFGIQGGGQAVMNGYNVGDVLTGTASVYGGAMWTPVLGTRLHLNAWESKEGVENWGTYNFKYGTATVDLMANLVSAINHRDNNAVDLYLIGGIGANKVWGHNYPAQELGSKVHNHVAHTCKLGLMLDVNFSRYVALNLEVDAYHHGNHDYAHEVNMSKDWQLTAQLGLKFAFPGKCKKAAPKVVVPEPVQPEPEPVVEEPAPAPQPAPVVKEEPAPVVKEEPAPKAPESLRREVFYVIKGSQATDDNAVRVDEAAQWLKAHPQATASIEGYADRGTGNPNINKTYAEKRANAVKKALVKAGIAVSRLTVKSYGDTVQPFAENDKNRCVIIIAEEK